jgi:hypothetical protein
MRLTLNLIIFISIGICISADAAMLRVVGVHDGRTILVERGGKQETMVLGGVEILDEARARDLLNWTLDSAWVMLERTASGEVLVFRTPDALFINRELVRRGYARATLREVAPEIRLNVTYLGQVDPPGVRSRITAPESQTGSGTDRRSRAQPARRAKSSDRGSSTPRPGRRRARPSVP